jgi:hypothetical protein
VFEASNSNVNVITREQYLALTPATYLTGGFRDGRGQLRWELTSIWATAGATQLAAVTTQELGTTLMAMAQVLPLHDSAPAEWYRNACLEAYELTAGLLNHEPSRVLVAWLEQFTRFVRSVQDLQDLVTHLGAVARQHALFAGMRAGHGQPHAWA